MADTEQLPNECAVCSTPCVEMYCSEHCYLMGTGKGFACGACGVVKPMGRGKNLFCSLNCSVRYKKERAIKAVNCKFCGKTFIIPANSNRYKERPRFCSAQCVTCHRVKLLTHPPVTQTCIVCKVVVVLTHDKKKTLRKTGKVFCTAKCAAVHRNQNR
jgi:hypothetical protein